MEIKKIKGTEDIIDTKAKNIKYINNLIDNICASYNYEFIRTPIFEESELFHRGIGSGTDIVSKETYDFVDRGDRKITLRPEGTAGAVRSYIENKMYGNRSQPVKLYYNGTMYRYERPQAGRNREFTQFGIEVLGSNDPLIDAEVISLPVYLLNLIGIKGVKVKINSLGNTESRKKYRDILVKYFEPNIEKLCPDCQNRLKSNPLRILDCKFDKENDILKNAPKIIDYLDEEASKRFKKVQEYLDVMEIDYEVDANIVRGLDYYCDTVFEISAGIPALGGQNVLGGGGRYNNLVKELGGPDTPGMGFAMGLDRVLIAVESEDIKLGGDDYLDAFVMYVSDTEKVAACEITHLLRQNGYNAETEYMARNLKGQFKQADRFNVRYYILLNDEELKNGGITIKDVQTKEEEKIKKNDLIDYMDMNF